MEGKSKVVNPERIKRIFKKMCDGNMLALIRTKANPSVGIRTHFFDLGMAGKAPIVKFSGISNAGLKRLIVGDVVRFEVIGMPSQVLFQAKVGKIQDGVLICRVPQSIVAIERRAAARSATSPSIMAYMTLGSWQPNVRDIATPPCFSHYQSLLTWIPILDISVGGVCLSTRFPAVIDALEGVELEEEAHLILPAKLPIHVPSTIRWKRRIKESYVNEVDGEEKHRHEYRLGVEFNHLDNQKILEIKQFLRSLTVAESI